MPRVPFSFSAVNLLTLDERVSAPDGIVYSTGPRKAEGEDEGSYFVKGPDLEIVFAELCGAVLASAVGLPVPPAAACACENGVMAGSRAVEIRDVKPFLSKPRNVANFEDLFSMVVVDTWLCNIDRNSGNVVGSSFGHTELELMCIDFERAVALHPNPTTSAAMIRPEKLWPTGELGASLRRAKPLFPPAEMIRRISGITSARCRELIEPVCAALPEVPWVEDCVFAVGSRATRIGQLAQEVWRC